MSAAPPSPPGGRPSAGEKRGEKQSEEEEEESGGESQRDGEGNTCFKERAATNTKKTSPSSRQLVITPEKLPNESTTYEGKVGSPHFKTPV
ncbi:hypothetical protein EYF80_014260 [Liparis tanakae]|uniref:Uncharacterized protein n=1 Tax=Liparis tanakae TaxID=230148 RepID=A0A4Z2IBR3_9TELE|nr:hypothetical protein EYF80_014260 [Liparis tanakae]